MQQNARGKIAQNPYLNSMHHYEKDPFAAETIDCHANNLYNYNVIKLLLAAEIAASFLSYLYKTNVDVRRYI